MTYDTEPRTQVKPYWLDIKNCLSDPVFDVPGGGKKGSTYRRSIPWTVPESGRLVAGGGHVHGGAKNLVLPRPDCKTDGHVYTLPAALGNPDHPFYNVRPVLHEPGPVNMSGFISRGRASGQQRARSSAWTRTTTAELLHTRVMGIMLVYLAPDESVSGGCGPPPSDLADYGSTAPAAPSAPRFKVPLTGLDSNGNAQTISKPPGAAKAREERHDDLGHAASTSRCRT